MHQKAATPAAAIACPGGEEPTAANLPHAAAAGRQTDRQIDRWMDTDRATHHAAVSIIL